MDFKNKIQKAKRLIYHAVLCLFVAFFSLNCFTSEKSLPGVFGEGEIYGKVVGSDGTPIRDVTVTTSYKGQTYTTLSKISGSFSIKIPNVQRGEGFQLQLTKTDFDTAFDTAIITLPNLKVDKGNIVMRIEGGSIVETHNITGMVYDNFSYRPLVGANVSVTDSAGKVRIATTDTAGKFSLESNYFKTTPSAPYYSYLVTVYHTNYIMRNDIVAKISTSKEIPIENNPIRLYQKFGAIYGYVLEDTIFPEVYLDGVEATVVDSNNQSITCITGGPYNAEPLNEGEYCPDLSDIPTGPANDGFKVKSMFLLLGKRYNIELKKTSAACIARTTGTSGCYRTKTVYSDLYLTLNNAISGEKTQLMWDAWIEGTVTGGAGAGVVVKLYDNNDTYLTQTTTNGSGKFIFDNPQILRSKPYKLTFEKEGYYSRLLHVPDGTKPCAPFGTMYQSEIPVTITVTGSNNVGSVPMTPLCPPSSCVQGTVKDYYTNQVLPGANVRVFDGGWRTATTDTFGKFYITGNFVHPPDRTGSRTFANTDVTALSISTADLRVGMLVKGTGLPPNTRITNILTANSIRLSEQSSAPGTVNDNLQFMMLHDMEIKMPGYTGATDRYVQKFQFGHDGSTTCPGNPYDISVETNACEVYDVGPVGNKNCASRMMLYPIGIFSNVGNFKFQIKQTYEKFLTEKTGLTISARAGNLLLTYTPQRNTDYDAFYLHFDDTPKALPAVIEGTWSNNVAVNADPIKCDRNLSSECSPRANGVFAESIGNDTRAYPWGIRTYVYYHFYAGAAGTYTIETTGSTDPVITLYAQTGANLGTDDDSGSGSNARITKSLLKGWYYVKVAPKNNSVFGFFDVVVTGPGPSDPANPDFDYAAMLSPTSLQSVEYQTVSGTASYGTTCAPGNGNFVMSWYSKNEHLMYIAAPGENGGCNGTATIEKHGPVGGIIRGHFSGRLRSIAPAVINQDIINGFFNVIRSE